MSFPTSPAVGDTHTNPQGTVFEYVGNDAWKIVGGGASTVSVSGPITGTGETASPLDVDFAALSTQDCIDLVTACNLAQNARRAAGAPSGAPASGDGDFYVDTAKDPDTLYHWDGSAWQLIGTCCIPDPSTLDFLDCPDINDIADRVMIWDTSEGVWKFTQARFLSMATRNPNFDFRRVGNQIIPSGVITTISGHTNETYNTLIDSTWDGTTLTLGEKDAGMWQINAEATITHTANTFTTHRLARNGVTLDYDQNNGNFTQVILTGVQATIRLGAGDTITHSMAQTSGANRTLTADPSLGPTRRIAGVRISD